MHFGTHFLKSARRQDANLAMQTENEQVDCSSHHWKRLMKINRVECDALNADIFSSLQFCNKESFTAPTSIFF